MQRSREKGKQKTQSGVAAPLKDITENINGLPYYTQKRIAHQSGRVFMWNKAFKMYLTGVLT